MIREKLLVVQIGDRSGHLGVVVVLGRATRVVDSWMNFQLVGPRGKLRLRRVTKLIGSRVYNTKRRLAHRLPIALVRIKLATLEFISSNRRL